MGRQAGLLAVAGAGLALAGCGSWLPSVDFNSVLAPTPQSGTLQVESEPPGADARSSTGPSCKTPCSIPVPGTGEFTISFALNGYVPQTIPVRALPPENREIGQPPVIRYEPATAFAQLQPMAPPKKKNRKVPPKTANAPGNAPRPPPQPQ